jgi:hypothetical protein
LAAAPLLLSPLGVCVLLLAVIVAALPAFGIVWAMKRVGRLIGHPAIDILLPLTRLQRLQAAPAPAATSPTTITQQQHSASHWLEPLDLPPAWKRGSFEVSLALAVMPFVPPAVWMTPALAFGFPVRSLFLATLLGNTPWVCLQVAASRSLPVRLAEAALYMRHCRTALQGKLGGGRGQGWDTAAAGEACWDAYDPQNGDGLVQDAWQLQLAFALAVALPLLVFKTHHSLLWAHT